MEEKLQTVREYVDTLEEIADAIHEKAVKTLGTTARAAYFVAESDYRRIAASLREILDQ